MVVIDPRILSKTVKTMTPKKERVEEAQVRGTVVYQSGEHYIRLDGATNDSLTPVANIEEDSNDSGFTHGDRVLVLIKNHQAIVTKNLTTGLQANAAKDASEFTTAITDEGITADRIIANDTFTNTLRANGITADEIIAGQAVIDTLDTNYAHITDGVIDNAKIGYADVDGLSANFAHITDGIIDNAVIDYADVNNLNAHYAEIQNGIITNATIDQAKVNNLSANYAHVSNGVIDNAKIGYADVENLNAHYASIDLANVNNAWIQNGVVKNAAISDAQIIGISANKLTAGTIDASNIVVTNLNADNITTGTINGQRIGNGSIDLEKLSEEVPTKEYLDNVAENLQGQIDGQIETWTGTAIPTLQNSPASSWNTNALKDSHVGDVYFVVNSQSQQNGYNYRFTKSGSTYSWQLIKDTDITNALQRISTAEGKITTFDSDISQLKTDTGTLTTKTTSLETRMSDAENDILDKVDTTTFNSVSDTVDQHTQTISQHTTAISNKADSSTVTAVTSRVSKNEQDITGINTTIGELQDTIETKADGSTVETVSNKLNTVSDTVDGHTQTLTSVQNTLVTKADSSTVSTLQQNYATFKQQTEQFESTVGTTYATKEEFNNLEVGGRNLLLWSAPSEKNHAKIATPSSSNSFATEDGCACYKITGSATNGTQYASNGKKIVALEADTQYTYSAWVKLTTTGSTTNVPFNFTSLGHFSIINNATASDTTHEDIPAKRVYSPDTVSVGVWTKIQLTFTTNSLNGSKFGVYPKYSLGDAYTLFIRDQKLEKGNKATDWTPAPEDIETRMSSAETVHLFDLEGMGIVVSDRLGR